MRGEDLLSRYVGSKLHTLVEQLGHLCARGVSPRLVEQAQSRFGLLVAAGVGDGHRVVHCGVAVRAVLACGVQCARCVGPAAEHASDGADGVVAAVRWQEVGVLIAVALELLEVEAV